MSRLPIAACLWLMVGCIGPPAKRLEFPPTTLRQTEGAILGLGTESAVSPSGQIIFRYFSQLYSVSSDSLNGPASNMVSFALASREIRRIDGSGYGMMSTPRASGVWIATSDPPRRVIRFDIDSKTLLDSIPFPSDSLIVLHVQEDSEGNVWAVAQRETSSFFIASEEDVALGAGTYVWSHGSWRWLLETLIDRSFRHGAGKILGLAWFDPEISVFPFLAEIDSSGNIRPLGLPPATAQAFSLATTPTRGTLAATLDWVWRYDETSSAFSQLDAPAIENKWVQAVLESNDRRLWLAGNEGIYFSDDEVNWKQLLWTESTGKRYEVDVSGKTAKLFPDRLHYDSVAQDAQGAIWFFSGPVIVRVNPETMEVVEFRSTYPLRVLASSLEIDIKQDVDDPLAAVKPIGPFPTRSILLPLVAQ